MKQKVIRACTVSTSIDLVEGILPELNKRYEVVLLSSPGPEMDAVTEEYGVRGIRIPMRRHISLRADVNSLWYLVKIFRNEKPMMVHSMTPKAGLLCMIAAWLTRVPVRVHTFTGLVFPTSTGIKRKILMLTDGLTCACATHIIPEGEGVKNDLLRNKITKKPLRVLGYGNVKGVDLKRFSAKTKISSGFVFLFVGRIVRDKGINELVAAFCRLNKKYPDSRLVLVGVFEDDLNPISIRTRQAIENSSAINVVGEKSGDELVAYYASADCYVFPSYREGFPNTVLEAGAMGLPCIVTDINGSREIIENGKNGLIISPRDEKALYEAMESMINESETRERMGKQARMVVGSKFEQGFVCQCLMNFYDEIIPNHV